MPVAQLQNPGIRSTDLFSLFFPMKTIYQVNYEEKWTGTGWTRQSENVLANGDAQVAVDRVRKASLKQSYVADDTGKTHRCTGFRLRAVSVLAEAG